LKLSPWLLLVLAALAWRIIYAYWTPLVNRYVVPPGDDPAFHLPRIADNLAGHWGLLENGYPLGFHFVTALVAKIANWDALTAIRLVGPALLVLPIPILYFVGKRLFSSAAAGAFAAAAWAFLALAPVRAYGDGNYPNMLAGGVLLPLGLLFLLGSIRKPNRKTIISTVVIFVAIAFIHHLTFAYSIVLALPLLLWWSWQILTHPERKGNRPLILAGAVVVATGLGLLLWPFYKPLLLPFLETLRTQGTLASFFGAQSTPITWQGLLEVHNPFFLMLGLAGGFLILVSNLERPIKVLLTGWIGLLWLLSTTSVFGLPERFARELAVPLALAAGYFLSFFFQQAKTWPGRLIFLALPLLLIFSDWRASFQRPFALPDPYKPLIRVQHEEEFALAALRDAVPPGTTILANNSNPYLPFLVQEKVIIVPHPDQVTSLIASQPISLLYIGSRPPLTPEDIYPFYVSFDAIREQMMATPNKEKIAELPSGTEIYRLSR